MMKESRSEKHRRMGMEYIAKGAWPEICGEKNTKLLKTARAYELHTGIPAVCGGFGLPAVVTCPGARDCIRGCYATKGNYGYQNIVKRLGANLHGLGTTKQSATIAICRALKSWYDRNRKPMASTYLLRIHDSGDFFSQYYLDAWTQSIKAFVGAVDSKHTFIAYGYTKSLHLDFTEFLSLDCVKFVQSMGGKYQVDFDYGVAAIVPKGSVISGEWIDANNDDSIMDLGVILGHKKIALEYHGSGDGSQWPTTEQIDQGITVQDTRLITIGSRS